MLDGNTTQDRPSGTDYMMFRGPAAYVPRTPWRPLPAVGGVVAIALFAVIVVVAVFLGIKFFGPDLDELHLGLVLNPIMQAALVAGTMWAARSYNGKPGEILALQRPAQGFKAYAVSFLVLIALVAAMGFVIQSIDPASNKEKLKPFMEMFKSSGWWMALLMVGVGAPLSEELVFRGFLFPALAKTRLGLWGAALATSAPWALVHLAYSPLGMLQVFVIGLIFSWMLIRTGSLRVTMLCHALYNSALGLALMADGKGWMG